MTDYLNPRFDNSGRLITDDNAVNNIIRAVEAETGARLVTAMPAITFEGTNPDEKIYLLLLALYGSEDDPSDYTSRDWVVKSGRQNVYDYLKDLVKNEAIDPHASFVVAGDIEIDEARNKDDVNFNSKAISVFRFLKVMFESNKVLDDRADFDINEYDPINYIHGDTTILEI